VDILRVHKVTLPSTCNASCCCDTWEEVPSVFDMLGGIGRKDGIWEL